MTNMIERVIDPRGKDLGGFEVRRVLPHHARKTVGPFIFFDHLGPADFAPGKGIDVRPHPHIGLATVTYLFDGALFHRDTLGNEIVIEPGAVNWMTAGRGISHSERTPDFQRTNGHRIHAIQTWVALPRDHEEDDPAFVHHPAGTLPVFDLGGAKARLIAGDAFGHTSPVEFAHEILYLAVTTGDTAAKFTLPAICEERAIYLVDGAARLDGEEAAQQTLSILTPDTEPDIHLEPHTRIMIAGGAPMDGKRHIEWNFVSSRPERIDQAKADWRASAYGNWQDTSFGMPPKESEYIPLPGDPEAEPQPGS